jgi:hypothetical protein
VSTVELDTIVSCLLEVLGGMCEAFNDVLDVFLGGSTRLREGHTHDVALKLDIRCGNGILLDGLRDLSTRMADLTDDQGAVLLGLGGELLETLESLALVG